MEILDIVDERNELTGKTASREEIHNNGLWHRKATCWIMNEKGEILLQKIAKQKKNNAGKWTRIGGHIKAGETPLDGVIREVREEIGIKLKKENIRLLYIRAFEKPYKETGLHRYWSYNYFALVNYKIEEYVLQKEEVSEVKYMKIEEMEKLVETNNQDYAFVKWENINDVIAELKRQRAKIK